LCLGVVVLNPFPKAVLKPPVLADGHHTLARWSGVLELHQSTWTAPAEHGGDGAFAWYERLRIDSRLTQSGVALRLPPYSMTRSDLPSVFKLREASGLRRIHRRFSPERGCVGDQPQHVRRYEP
jgi:hypothetical protein